MYWPPGWQFASFYYYTHCSGNVHVHVCWKYVWVTLSKWVSADPSSTTAAGGCEHQMSEDRCA